MKYLVGNRVKLVKFAEKHITASYMEWLNDHEVNRYMFVGRIPICREEVPIPSGHNEMRFAMMSSLSYDSEKDALVQGQDHIRYIGTASMSSIDWVSRRAEIGYMIGDKNYWGVGIATEVVALLSNYALNRLNMNKVEAGVVEGNEGSVKVLKRNGFREYCRIPQEYYLEGKYLDAIRFCKFQ